MTRGNSAFQRDWEVAWQRYPKEMERLETLRTGLDDDFPSAYRYLREQGHLIPKGDGTYVLLYEIGKRTVGIHLYCDEQMQRAVDLAVVLVPACARLVEVVHDQQDQNAPHRPGHRPLEERLPRTDCQGECVEAATVRFPRAFGRHEDRDFWGFGHDHTAGWQRTSPSAQRLYVDATKAEVAGLHLHIQSFGEEPDVSR